MKKSKLLQAVLGVILAGAPLFAATTVIKSAVNDKNVSAGYSKDSIELNRIVDVINIIETNFVGTKTNKNDKGEKIAENVATPSKEELYKGAVEGVVRKLDDPYSEYLSTEDLKDFTEDMDGEYTGVGMSVSKKKGEPLEVVSPFIGSPAEKVGMRIKDKITKVDGKDILAGNTKLMDLEKIAIENEEKLGTVVYVAIDGKYAGNIVIADEIKEDSESAIFGMKKQGIKNIVMLTGDNKKIGENVAKKLGITKVFSELLPTQKVEKLEEIMIENGKNTGKVLFVGDGINDAPVLARADVGVAMGGVGSDAAIEAADVVIMNDEPSKIVTAIEIAKKTKTIVWQNIIFALAVKGIILIMGALGFATMWEAVFGDVGVALIAILNSMRTMYFFKK
ncbi:MAG: HAD-IC family P-type ATPase [Leptotrichia wadei]|nr:HAD-IC family P-type ATPase [Leptotrichia wadei]MBS6020543.1 HAD-IC family P-type ATPase [Leptotrichia wadei]